MSKVKPSLMYMIVTEERGHKKIDMVEFDHENDELPVSVVTPLLSGSRVLLVEVNYKSELIRDNGSIVMKAF